MPFLRSIASDLTEKRLWPVVALLAVALIGVFGYVSLHGGSTPPVTPIPANPTPSDSGPVPVSAAGANPNQAIAETTSGFRFQRQGGAHDPFTPLTPAPAPKAVVRSVVTAASNTTSSQVSVGSSSQGASPTSSPSTPSSQTSPPSTAPKTTSKPTAPSSKPATTYHIDVRFGTVPTAAGQPAAQITDYKDLARLASLPDPTNPVVVFLGVREDGKTVTFNLMHEAILRGPGTCRPDALKCQLLDLKAGQTEQLDYLNSDLSVTRYQLEVVSVAGKTAATASAARAFNQRVAPMGHSMLKRGIRGVIGGLVYSTSRGVLITNPRASAALARSAGQNLPGHGVSASRARSSSSSADALARTADGGSSRAGAGDAAANADYAPPLPSSGPPAVQPGWLDVLLRVL